ncbi:MAG: DUF2809 domain-containing protein [Fibrobacter sp.]|nr:DUF2809 domain-containing protein [Fibrobacter sp.]
MIKKRIYLLFSILFVIAAGLLSRSPYIDQSSFIGTYAGDTLWALMVFIGFRFLFIKEPIFKIFVISFLFSCFIEVSQLYHATWIDKLRGYRLGGLILGFGFKWSDIICYAVGCFMGFLSLWFQIAVKRGRN